MSRALAGDENSLRTLVDYITPVVHARVVRALFERNVSVGYARDARQEVEDLVQEVFVALFSDDARALRSWDPARGLSFLNYVGLLARREVASILRSGRRNPWREQPTTIEELVEELGTDEPLEIRIQSKELFAIILSRLEERLSTRGLELFEMLIIEQRPVEAVCEETGLKPDAVYAWRSRLAKLVRRIGAELQSEVPLSEVAGSRRKSSRDAGR